MKWKVGDFAFTNYELVEIIEMDGDDVDDITSVSTGVIRTSGYMNNVTFPLTLRIKNISDSVAYYSKELHAIKRNLNHPDLHRELVKRWVEMCEEKDDTKVKDKMTSLQAFIDKIKEAATENVYVEGVRIFR